MAALRGRAVFLLWLLLSTLAPCDARRFEIHFSEQTRSESAKQREGGIKCPSGLAPNEDNEYCTSEKFDKSSTSDFWSTTGSDAPLLFEPSGGVFMIESQFLAEMAVAFTDPAMKLKVASALADEQMKRNVSFKAMYLLKAKEHSKFHTMEEDLKPGFFLLEHTAEHLVLEGLAIGFHAVEHAAHAGALVGGATLEAVAGLTAEVLSFIVADILPILLPIQAAVMLWQVRRHFKHQTHHAKDFTSHMVFKSDCIVQQLEKTFVSTDLTLKPDIGQLCTPVVATELEKQIQRTTHAKVEVFKLIASIGRCLWPHNERPWEKIGCVEAVYFKTLQVDGKAGILYSALSLMGYYGQRVDELLEAPYYRQWYQEQFGIENQATDISLLPQLLKVRDSPLEERLPVCMQLMATHRAFERTFVRIKGAIQVWIQTFSRTIWKTSIRGSWVPCQKVFYKLEDWEQGMCKQEDWRIGHGEDEHAIDEHDACEKAAAYTGSLWPETEDKDKSDEDAPGTEPQTEEKLKDP